jgi:hypothetical protein
MTSYLKKSFVAALMILELFLISLLFADRMIDRQDLARAVANNIKNPTPENEAILDREHVKTGRILFAMDTAVVLLIVINTWGIVVLLRRKTI